jgi:PD-(D/E)XK endonuclease
MFSSPRSLSVCADALKLHSRTLTQATVLSLARHAPRRFDRFLSQDRVVRGCPHRYFFCVRTTQRKGDVATARAIATFTAMGFDVSIPLTESAAYDLVVDDGEGLARVQCKFANNARREVDLRRIHSNSTGYVVKRTQEGAYDWLYVLDGENVEYLIRQCLPGRRSVTLRDADKLGAVAESGRLQLP